MRIVAFVGSQIEATLSEKAATKLGEALRKNNIAIDIVCLEPGVKSGSGPREASSYRFLLHLTPAFLFPLPYHPPPPPPPPPPLPFFSPPPPPPPPPPPSPPMPYVLVSLTTPGTGGDKILQKVVENANKGDNSNLVVVPAETHVVTVVRQSAV